MDFSKGVTESDLHFLATIFRRSAAVVSSRDRLLLALGLELADLEEIKLRATTDRSGSYGFFAEGLSRWISRSSEQATFGVLITVLRSEGFMSTADSILRQPQGGNYFGGNIQSPNSLLDTEPEYESILFDVPERVVSFTGRKCDLQKLHESIMTQNNDCPMKDVTVVTAVSGLGGIGKTTLSIQYAWSYFRTFYFNIAWINSESYITRRDSFSSLADRLNLKTVDDYGKPIMLEVIAKLIYKHFEKDPTLFVFDNVEKFEDIKSCLPARVFNQVRAYVLLTSRSRVWNDRVGLIDLDVFDVGESIEFFQNYLNLSRSEELSSARTLADQLGNLPLAVKQAGAYIKFRRNRSTTATKHCNTSNCMLLRQYIKELHSNSYTVLDYEYWRHTDDIYEKTTFKTWNITLQCLRELDPSAVKLMELVSYYNPDNIPIRLFSRSNNGEQEFSLSTTAVDLLSEFSMIVVNDIADTFNVHRLVQKVIQIQIEHREAPLLPTMRNAVKLLLVPLRLKSGDYFEEASLIHSKHILQYLKPLDEFELFINLVNAKEVVILEKQLNVVEDLVLDGSCRDAHALLCEYSNDGIVKFGVLDVGFGNPFALRFGLLVRNLIIYFSKLDPPNYQTVLQLYKDINLIFVDLIRSKLPECSGDVLSEFSAFPNKMSEILECVDEFEMKSNLQKKIILNYKIFNEYYKEKYNRVKLVLPIHD